MGAQLKCFGISLEKLGHQPGALRPRCGFYRFYRIVLLPRISRWVSKCSALWQIWKLWFPEGFYRLSYTIRVISIGSNRIALLSKISRWVPKPNALGPAWES